MAEKRVTWEAGIIGGNLRNLRQDAGFSMQHIATVLNITYQQLQKYESGQNRLPAEKLYNIKMFFNVPFEALFRGLGSPEIDESLQTYSRLQNIKDPILKGKLLKIVDILLS